MVWRDGLYCKEDSVEGVVQYVWLWSHVRSDNICVRLPLTCPVMVRFKKYVVMCQLKWPDLPAYIMMLI